MLGVYNNGALRDVDIHASRFLFRLELDPQQQQSKLKSPSSSGVSSDRFELDSCDLISANKFVEQVSIQEMLRGRGRGRGIQFAKDYLEDDCNFPATSPLRPREDPTLSQDSDEEDDFISTFRKLHPNASTSSSSSTTASTPSPQIPPGLGAGVGRGRGRGLRGRSILDAEILQCYPTKDPGMRISRPITTQSPFHSPATSSTSRSSDDRSLSSAEIVMERRVVEMRGNKGDPVSICANYIRFRILKNTGFFEYHVDFEPFIDSRKLRNQMMRGSSTYIGSTLTFDGAKLYLPIKLTEKLTQFTIPHPIIPNESVDVTVKFVKRNELDECTHFYNILLRRVMDKLGYVEMQRNFYDYNSIYQIPEHKLEIWPGFVTAVDLYEDGLMMCCESTFRVLRTSTMLDALYQMMHIEDQTQKDRHNYNYKEKFTEFAVGKIVVTKYNNKHYKIDDVDWTCTPRSKFKSMKRGQLVEISFVDYYRNNYAQEVKDFDQPLLVTRGKVKRQIHALDFSPPDNIMLVPQFCFITGMAEDITSDFRIMKAIAEKTRIPPIQRYNALEKFIKSVNEHPDVRQIFEDWGLQMADGVVNLNGRVIGTPNMIVGKGQTIKPFRGDFGRDLMNSHILEPIEVRDWILVCASFDDAKATKVVQNYGKVAPPLGIPYRGDPQIIRVNKSTPSDFRQALVRNIREGITQFVMVIIPSNRDDLYRVVKQVCTKELPVASQVIRGVTLNDERKMRSVMQKVALQINCKLGGSLWTIKIPLPDKIMFLGMDVYHDPSRKNPSVTAVVATVNACYTKYYTRVIFQQTQQENISSLRPVLLEALQTFYEENQGAFPDRVIMFRDGVGDGQLQLTREHEVAQMTSCFDELNITPKFTFCVVQKRINTRMFLMQGSHVENPEPGTVLDHTVTRRYHYDFFLVSQLIREGTVNPTHYIVLHDTANMSPDTMQKFAYATSFMYYNWSGSIRVPAMCQYAHKAASLVGQHLRAEPSAKMTDKLYYL